MLLVYQHLPDLCTRPTYQLYHPKPAFTSDTRTSFAEYKSMITLNKTRSTCAGFQTTYAKIALIKIECKLRACFEGRFDGLLTVNSAVSAQSQNWIWCGLLSWTRRNSFLSIRIRIRKFISFNLEF